jgi:hypothetical protein
VQWDKKSHIFLIYFTISKAMGLFARGMLQQVTKGDGSQMFNTLQLEKIHIILKKSHYKLLTQCVHVKV